MSTKCKLLAVVLAVVFAFVGLVSCKKDDKPGPDSSSVTDSESKSEPVGSDEPSESESESGSQEPGPSGSETSGTDVPPEPKEYVEIANEADLVEAAKKISANTDGYASKKFKLTADIALTSEFTPITGFTGIFDGQFHTISGLTVDSDLSNVGLFSTLDGATVQNLNIEAVSVNNSAPVANVGILAGSVQNATVSFVTVSGKVELGGNRAVAGGVVGEAANTTLLNVKSTATVTGGGAVAAGIVGNLNEKAMLVNAYSNASITATASIKASAVGNKLADSAVAFVLVKSGDVVGKAEKLDYLPSYVVGCKVGASASAMGWNSVDWDVSGTEPSLNKTLDKKYPALKVTVDGKAVSVSYGQVLPASAKPQDPGENKLFAGFMLGGEGYYEALPVVNDLSLKNDIVDLTSLAGTWVSLNSNTANLTVDKTLSGLSGAKLLGFANENGMPVVYFKNTDNSVSRLSLKTLSTSEKSKFGYVVDGAALLVTEKAAGNGYETVAYYMPTPAENLGAWTVGGKQVIYTADVVADGGVNSFRSMNVGVSLGVYKTCVTVSNGKVVKVFDGYKFEERNGAPALVNGSLVATVAKDCYEGNWVDINGSSVVIEGGKIGTTALTVKTTADGTGLWDSKTETLYVVNVSGLTAYKAGKSTGYSKGNFSGEWLMLENGKESVLTIAGNKVTLPDGKVVTAKVTADPVTGVASIVIPMSDGTEVTFSGDGILLKSSDGKFNFYSAKAVNSLYGTYTLGTKSFKLENGVVTVYEGTKVVATENIVLEMVNGALTAKANEMVFALEDGKMYVTGAKGYVLDAEKLRLFTDADLALVYAGMKGNWTAVAFGVKYPAMNMVFENHVLTIDGTSYKYDFTVNSKGKISLLAVCKYEGKEVTLTLTPVADSFIETSGASIGSFMPDVLADSVGNYYEFLIGSTEEGAAAPKVIRFSHRGELTLNGNKYVPEDYELILANGQILIKIINPSSPDYLELVTFTGAKTLRYRSVTYTNYDYVLPADEYYQIGATDGVSSIKVLQGSTGYYKYDEEEEEDVWVEPVYPLFGFSYTDAKGKVYTSDSFTWEKANGTVTLQIHLKSADDKVVVLTAKYPAGNDFSRMSVSVNNGKPVDYYSKTELSTMAGSYKNDKHSFELGADGVLVLDGKKVAFTVVRKNGVDTFTADGKTYVIDRAVPEIMKCGSEVFYDARFAHLAQVELESFRRGDAKADKKFSMILTDKGFYFDGEKVVWDAYDMLETNIRFTVNATINGSLQEVTWQFERSGDSIMNFGLLMYPNASFEGDSGWPQRWFVPAVLLDASTSYATDANIITVQPADYSNGFVPFIFMIDSAQYDYSDYTLASDGGRVVVYLDSENTLTFEETASGIKVTLNGETAAEYDAPPLDDYEIDNVKPFGGDNFTYGITISGGTITYNPTSSWPSKTTVYSNGVWDGMPVIYFTASGKDFAVVKTEHGPVPVMADLLNLIGTVNCYGTDVTVTLDLSGETPVLNIVHGGTAATDIVIDSENMPSDNEMYIEYTVDGKTYAIVPDVLNGGSNIVLTKELFDAIGKCDNLSVSGEDFSLYIYPDVDRNGNGILTYQVFDKYNKKELVNVTPKPVSGVDNLYTITYTISSKSYTSYVAIFSGKISSYDDDQAAVLGTHTASNGQTIVVGPTEGYNEYNVTYRGSTVTGSWDSGSKSVKFKVTVDGEEIACYANGSNGTVTVSELSAKKDAFITSSGYSSGYYTAGNSSYKALVAYVNGNFQVTYRSTAATDVVFNESANTITFKYDGKGYVIVMVDDTQTTDYYRAVVVTAEQYGFIGKWGTDKVLQVSVSAGYSASISASYDGKTASELVFHSATLMSFKVGATYYAASIENGSVKIYEDILDTTDILYNFLGYYEDRNITVGFELTKTASGVVANYTVTKNGTALSYTMDPKTRVITITENGTAKFYTFCVGDKYMAELTAEDLALLGEFTVGTDTVVITPNYKVKMKYDRYEEEYVFDGYEAGYKLKLNSGSEISVKFENDNGTPAKKYVKFTSDGKTYLFFVKIDGSAALHELTDEQLAMFGVSISVSDGGTKYLKTSLLVADDGTYTLGLAFDGKAITDKTDISGFGYSFKSSEGKTYYVRVDGTPKFMVTAMQYAYYVTDLSVSGHTLTVTPGTSSSYMFKVSLDNESQVDGKYTVSGDYSYISFTTGGKTYFITLNTTANNAVVLTEVSGGDLALSTLSNSVKVYDAATGNYTSKSLKGMLAVNADGTFVVAATFDGKDAVCESVAAPTGMTEQIFKVTVGEDTLYVMKHGSYFASAAPEHFALMGTWTLADGKVLVVNIDPSRSWMTCLQVTYNESKSATGTDEKLYSGDTKFVTITVNGAATAAVQFTIDGTTYNAYLVNGVMTVVQANA